MILATTIDGSVTMHGNCIYQDGEGTYSVVLSQSNCRLIRHDADKDPLADRFEIKNAMQWWAVRGVLDALVGGSATTAFATAKRMNETHGDTE